MCIPYGESCETSLYKYAAIWTSRIYQLFFFLSPLVCASGNGAPCRTSMNRYLCILCSALSMCPNALAFYPHGTKAIVAYRLLLIVLVIYQQSTACERVNLHGSYESIPPVGALAALHFPTVGSPHRNGEQPNMQRHYKRIPVHTAFGMELSWRVRS